MAEVGNLSVSIGLESQEFQKSITQINQSMKVAKSEFKAASTAIGTYGNKTETLKARQEYLTKAVDLQAQKVTSLKAAYEKSATEKGEDAKKTQQLAVQYNYAQARLNSFQGQLNAANTALTEQDTKMDKLKKSVEKTNETFKKVAKGVAAAGAAIAAAGAGALKLALDMGNTADRLLDLNSITGMSTDEIQRWQQAAVDAGTSTEAVTEASQKLTMTMDTMSSGTGKAAEAAQKLGYSYDGLSAMDADTRMNALVSALQGVDDKTERAKIGTDLFGKKWAEIAPIIDLGAEGLAAVKANAHVFTPEQLNAANNFRIMWDNLQKTMKDFALIIGAELAPIMEDLMGKLIEKMPEIKAAVKDGVEKAVEIFGEFKDALGFVKDNANILIPVVTGLATTIGLMQIISTVNSLMTAWKASTLAQTIAQGGLNAVLTANPIGVVVVAIGALVAAGVALYKNWDSIKETASTLWTSLSETFGNIKDKIAGVFTDIVENSKTWIGDMIDNIKSTITANIQKVADGVGQIYDTVKEKFDDLILNIVTWIIGFIDAIKATVNTNIQTVVDAVTQIYDEVKNKIDELVTNIVTWITDFVDNIKSTVNTNIQTVIDAVTQIYDEVKNKIDELVEDIKTWIKNFIDNIKTAVTDNIQTVTDAATDIYDKVKLKIDDLVTDAKTWAKNMVDMFTQGIKDKLTSVGDAAKSIAQKVKDFLGFSSPTNEGPCSDSDKWAGNFMAMFAGGISDNAHLVETEVNNVTSTIKSGFDGAMAHASSVVASIRSMYAEVGAGSGIFRVSDDHIYDSNNDSHTVNGNTHVDSEGNITNTTGRDDMSKIGWWDDWREANPGKSKNEYYNAKINNAQSNLQKMGSFAASIAGRANGMSADDFQSYIHGINQTEEYDKTMNMNDSFSRYLNDIIRYKRKIEKYHSGGWVGLQSDEIPAILQKGEYVLSRDMIKNIQSTKHINISIDYEKLADAVTKKVGRGITQNITIESTTPLKPSEVARHNRRALEKIALEW